jgi:hypothetical protein
MGMRRNPPLEHQMTAETFNPTKGECIHGRGERSKVIERADVRMTLVMPVAGASDVGISSSIWF